MPFYPETKLTVAMRDGDFPIIVSLARHDLDLAKAALGAGAVALKVHLNAYHRATGTTFGSYAEERPFLEKLAMLGVPLLVMAGQETVPTAQEMDRLAELGFEAFNVYFDHLKPHLLQSQLRPVPALGEMSTNEDLNAIIAIPGAMMEASVASFADYGTPLGEADFSRYREIVASAGIPVIAPSQKRFVANDIPKLKAAGIAAPLLGVVVTGTTPQSMEAAVRPIADACSTKAIIWQTSQ
ncbi:hypothetical protein LH464_16070 [Neorhizobium sp. T786]|uniref:hypothetical protein n=1 Tax=Pseudorhizobium xiangyangii TaxID=2883104 RepID=UPI001CFFD914|nr:hypothetical protein [Neorhizobium xiangyangii]MCB5203986.1 hypothetical protein [Neorhizobium xiangyangii]